MAKCDALVVGAGILGLSTAYHIKRENPDAKVIVVEKRAAAGQGNTAKSAAMFRSFFYSTTNLTLADSSVEFYRFLQEKGKVNLNIKWTGYLWLFSKDHYRKVEPVLKELSRRGLNYTYYEEEELSRKLKMETHVSSNDEAKAMGLKDVFAGIFIPKAGNIDVNALLNFYEKEFLRMGGEIYYNTEVKKLIVEPEKPFGVPGEPYFWQKSRISGASTTKGDVKAEKTILAAGAWIPNLLDPLGIECCIKPKKRQLFSVKAKTRELKELLNVKGFNELQCMPFTILPEPSVYIKPAANENAFWISYGDDFPRAYLLEEEPQPEENFYRYGIYQVLVKYFPQFEGQNPSSAMAGLYSINTLDGQPVIFEKHGLIVVGGASGSGIMKADAIGRIASALYKGDEYAELYGNNRFRVSDLGLEKRRVENEKLII